MSALEEAREQARKALHEYQGALAAFAPTRLVRAAWFMSETLTALLDATEPRPITDEMVKAGARALNDAGWTYEGADEPGCWCEDCQAVCMPPARAILEAAEGARR